MRLKTEAAQQECEQLTRQFLDGGGLIAKINANGKIAMQCEGCGHQRAMDARGVAAWGSPPCARCGGAMRVR
jgi:hypothetical protein